MVYALAMQCTQRKCKSFRKDENYLQMEFGLIYRQANLKLFCLQAY